MIVVDTNVLAYLWLPGASTEVARTLLEKDPDWQAPLLWRSEFRNVLATLVRAGQLGARVAQAAAQAAESQMVDREHPVPTEPVLRLAKASGCSAYDCEYVALAERLGVPLVTSDAKLARAFPGLAVRLAEAAGRAAERP